ncbi:MAG: DUF3502 domain-containing protein [Anaerolineae bacterium]
MSSKRISRRKLFEFMAIGAAAAIGSNLLAACGQKATEPTTAPQGASSPAASQPTATQAKPAASRVTLKIAMPGDRPTAMDEVLAEAEKRLADTLNIKLDVVFAPWSDMNKLDLILQSGEPIDLIWDAPWWHMNQNVALGFYMILDDLLPQYAPHVLEVRPKIMWDANKFKGKIYGVPLGQTHLSGRSWYIRKDLREKLGLPPIKTMADMEAFMEAGHKEFPEMIVVNHSVGNLASYIIFADFDTSVRGVTTPAIDLLYFRGNDAIVRNLFEDRDPVIWAALEQVRRWFNSGYIAKDILTNGPNYNPMYGKTLVHAEDDFGVYVNVQQAVKALGGEMEWTVFFDRNKKRVSSFQQWNFICLAKVCKEPERALRFLDWANQKENYDLLGYGIPGKHWEPVGDDQYRMLSTDYYWFPYCWIWNPVHERINVELGEEAASWIKWAADPNSFEPDKTTGLNMDNEPVIDEATQLQALRDEYLTQFLCGLAEIEPTWAEYKGKANDLVKVVAAEYQRQIQEFLGA